MFSSYNLSEELFDFPSTISNHRYLRALNTEARTINNGLTL